MFQTLDCPPSKSPKSSRRWHRRKQGMQKHKKACKERRTLANELHKIIPQAADTSSWHFETIEDTLKDTNINVPKKRNGSAKALKQRHPQRHTKKVPVGHSGWKTIHGQFMQIQ